MRLKEAGGWKRMTGRGDGGWRQGRVEEVEKVRIPD